MGVARDPKRGRAGGLGGPTRLLVGAILIVALGVSGCAGILALAGWMAAASSIKSFIDDLNPSHPTYGMSGYVYIDRAANKLAVQGDATLPTGGNFVIYVDAPVSMDTSPPKTTTTNAQGFFQFTGIPLAETTHILTVTTPDGGKVQFTVRKDQPSITPITTSATT
ncbi:MAG TPA: hypothetical protein VGM19_11935 [Armatimonadota bacterium]